MNTMSTNFEDIKDNVTIIIINPFLLWATIMGYKNKGEYFLCGSNIKIPQEKMNQMAFWAYLPE